MNNLLSYSGIITKTKALESKVISYSNYQTISNMDTVLDFVSYLKNHKGYYNILTGIDETVIHRGQIEGIFINSLYQDFSRLYQFANPEQRKVLDLIFFRFEVNIIKSCLHMVYNQDKEYNLSLFTDFFNKHSKINIKALAASRSMEEFINHLKGTDYYHVLTTIQKTDITSFDYEMKLDIHYFMQAWKLKNKNLKGDNLKAETTSLGLEIDLLNIIWLYRSKKFYNIHTQDAYSYIIPVTYKLKKEKLIKLMEAGTMDEFNNVLRTTCYDDLIPSLTNGTIESLYQQVITKNYKLNKNKYPTSMAPISYYLHLKQLEINQLTTVIECIRYKLDPQDIMKYIIK
ncbi:MAG: V-type ATPase subunit [Anaerocolumna sp.]